MGRTDSRRTERTSQQSVNGPWRFRATGGDHDEWTTGTIPGDVYTDLLEAGIIDDPYDGDNELGLQWVGKTRWLYAPVLVSSVRTGVDPATDDGGEKELNRNTDGDDGDVDPESVVVRSEFDPDGDVETDPDFAVFDAFKRLELPEPELTVAVEGTDVVLEAANAALFVELEAPSPSGRFSDNYFHMGPGERIRVSLEGEGADGGTGTVDEATLHDALSVSTLRDAY